MTGLAVDRASCALDAKLPVAAASGTGVGLAETVLADASGKTRDVTCSVGADSDGVDFHGVHERPRLDPTARIGPARAGMTGRLPRATGDGYGHELCMAIR